MSHFANYNTASQFVRNRLGVSRLSPAQAEEVRIAVTRHKDRASRYSGDQVQPSTVALKRMLTEEVQAQIEPLVLENYRVSTSSWAGGKNSVNITISSTPGASGHSCRVWSKNGKWSGTNAIFRINVMPGWRKYVQAVPGLAIPGGLLTTHAKQIAPDVWEASWLVQGRGFELRVESGAIVRGSDGLFYHGKTEKSARAVVLKRQKAQLEAQLQATFSAELKSLSRTELISRYGSLIVSRSDSLKAGNCQSGTDNWIEIHFPGQNKATIAQILGASDRHEVLAAVKVAILRQAKQLQKA